RPREELRVEFEHGPQEPKRPSTNWVFFRPGWLPALVERMTREAVRDVPRYAYREQLRPVQNAAVVNPPGTRLTRPCGCDSRSSCTGAAAPWSSGALSADRG